MAVLLVDHFYMNRAKHGVQDVGGERTSGDGWVVTPAGSSNDVMFVGISTERLLKAVNALSATSQTPTRPVIIAEIEVYEEGVAGTKRGWESDSDIEDGNIDVLTLCRCDKARNCQNCVAQQEPYCAW